MRAAPPEGPPWDLPLDEAPLAFVDLEMTGLDASRDRVVEVCIERVRGEVIEARLHTLVRPDGGETGNAHVHGIDAAALAEAPTFSEVALEVRALLEGAVLVAHGASWDVAFFEAELARAGTPLKVPFYLDTLTLTRRIFSLERHSLGALRQHFGLDASRAHRADADVRALREVWRRCVEALSPTTPRDAWQVRIAEGKARDEIIAECSEVAGTGLPVTLTYRPRSRPAETMGMVILEVVSGLDPPRVIGYQLPGRGRRELRADRILRIERSTPKGDDAAQRSPKGT